MLLNVYLGYFVSTFHDEWLKTKDRGDVLTNVGLTNRRA